MVEASAPEYKWFSVSRFIVYFILWWLCWSVNDLVFRHHLRPQMDLTMGLFMGAAMAFGPTVRAIDAVNRWIGKSLGR